MLVRYDLNVFKANPFSQVVTVKDSAGHPISLNGYVPSGSIFDTAGERRKLADFNTSIVNAPSGSLSFSLSSAVMSGIPVTQGTYFIRVDSISGAAPIRVAHGYINIYPF